MQDAVYFAAFNLAANNRADVMQLLQNWTLAAARLTPGLPAQAGAQNEEEPGLDSGETMGITPAKLTIIFGFRAGSFHAGRR